MNLIAHITLNLALVSGVYCSLFCDWRMRRVVKKVSNVLDILIDVQTAFNETQQSTITFPTTELRLVTLDPSFAAHATLPSKVFYPTWPLVSGTLHILSHSLLFCGSSIAMSPI